MKIPIPIFVAPIYKRWTYYWWLEILQLPKTWWWRITQFVHRGRYGWAPQDTWSLDQYLDGVLAGSLQHLAETTHGAPNGLTQEEWEAKLREWAALSAERYQALFEDDIVLAELTPRHQAMMTELGKWWGALWD